MRNRKIKAYVYKSLPRAAVLLLVLVLFIELFPPSAGNAASGDTEDTSIVVEAARGSSDIILGTVLDKVSYRDGAGAGIYTSAVISVNETLKGDIPGSEITVTFAGGEAGDTGFWTSDMPDLKTSDSVFLFLNKIPPEAAPTASSLSGKPAAEQYAIFGGYQGKFTADNGKVGTLDIGEFEDMVKQILEGKTASIGDKAAATEGVVVPYSFSGNSWPHPPSPNVHFRVNENTADATGEAAAMQAAAATWNAAGAKFTFTYDGPSTATGYAVNGVNDIMWGSLSAGTLAVTCIWYNPATSLIFECDMEFNDNYNWSTALTCPTGYYDVETIGLHEFGHFLMLNDLYNTSDMDKVMCGFGIPGTTKRVLHPDDISGIRDIYGIAVAPPAAVNGAAENVTSSSARLYGEITATGGENPAAHIFWGKGDSANISGNWTNDVNLGQLGAGPFYTDISGLDPGTTYYYRCYVSNSAGDNWSSPAVSFQTLVPLSVSVSGNGTTTPGPGGHDYTPGSTVNLTAAAAVNWLFTGWTGPVADNASASTNVTLDAGKTVTANFIRTHGTLTLETNGSGSITPLSGGHTYPVNTVLNLVAEPAPGWRFDAWSGDTGVLSDGHTANATITINGDYHITANFSRPVLNVMINGGGSVDPGAGGHVYDLGSEVTVTAAPNGNWEFIDWTGAVSTNATSANITLDTDKTIAANFIRTHGDLTLGVSGSGAVTPSTGTNNYPVDTVVNIKAEPSPGWQFVQWSGDTSAVSNVNSASTTVTINGDYSITATFAQIGASNIGGGGGGGGGSAVIDEKTITGLLTLTDDSGYMYDNIEATSFDDLATLDIPFGTTLKNKSGGALSVITISNVKEPDGAQDGASLIGNVYDFQPAGAVFDPALPLTISYKEKDFPAGVTENMLCIALWDETTKSYVPLDFTIDTVKNTITARISHFSRYTILAVPRPAEFALSGLAVTPEKINLGDMVDVSVNIANNGDLGGAYTCTPILNGKELVPQTAVINGGNQTTLHFSFPALDRGTNNISIGGLNASFEVSLTPPAFKIVSLLIREDSVEIGQVVNISAIVSNTGQATGVYMISLLINNDIQEVRRVEVAGETSREIRFSYTATFPGRVKIQVNSLLNSVLVKEPPPPAPTQTTTVIIPSANEIPAANEEVPPRPDTGVIIGAGGGVIALAAVFYFVWRKRIKHST